MPPMLQAKDAPPRRRDTLPATSGVKTSRSIPTLRAWPAPPSSAPERLEPNALEEPFASLELEPIFVARGAGLRGYAARQAADATAKTTRAEAQASARARRAEAARAFEGVRRGRRDLLLFVDVGPLDLLDGDLFDPQAPLTQIAERVVLQLRGGGVHAFVHDLFARASGLRALGFRFALTDLHGSPTRLALLTDLAPEFVKLDVAALGDADAEEPALLAQAVLALCRRFRATVIADGVASTALAAALARAGCALLESTRASDDETRRVFRSGEMPKCDVRALLAARAG